MPKNNVITLSDEQKDNIVKKHLADEIFQAYQVLSNKIITLPVIKDAEKFKHIAQNHLNDCLVWIKAELIPALIIKKPEQEQKPMEVIGEITPDELKDLIEKI